MDEDGHAVCLTLWNKARSDRGSPVCDHRLARHAEFTKCNRANLCRNLHKNLVLGKLHGSFTLG